LPSTPIGQVCEQPATEIQGITGRRRAIDQVILDETTVPVEPQYPRQAHVAELLQELILTLVLIAVDHTDDGLSPVSRTGFLDGLTQLVFLFAAIAEVGQKGRDLSVGLPS
jgi:hypothetical protein